LNKFTNVENIKFLFFNSGIQVNKADRAGQATPLYIAAAETRNLEIVKLLARNGADLYDAKIRNVLVESFGEKTAQEIIDESANFEQQMLADQVRTINRLNKMKIKKET
jgi:hypothetical protein